VAAHESNGALMTECREHLKRFLCDLSASWSEGAINIEEADGLLDRPVLERGVQFGHIEGEDFANWR
jgi:hypothetical protein